MKRHLFVFFCGTLLLILASCAEQAYYKDAKFDQNHDEYMPIPYNQIFFAGGAEGVYKQNPGY